MTWDTNVKTNFIQKEAEWHAEDQIWRWKNSWQRGTGSNARVGQIGAEWRLLASNSNSCTPAVCQRVQKNPDPWKSVRNDTETSLFTCCSRPSKHVPSWSDRMSSVHEQFFDGSWYAYWQIKFWQMSSVLHIKHIILLACLVDSWLTQLVRLGSMPAMFTSQNAYKVPSFFEPKNLNHQIINLNIENTIKLFHLLTLNY